ncbi:MAG: TolC family protein [Syntrophales bacterium]
MNREVFRQPLQAGKGREKIMKSVLRVIICLVLLLGWGMASLGVSELLAEVAPEKVSDDGKKQAAVEKAERAPASGVLAMSLRDFVRSVRDKNEQIAYQHAEWAVSRQAVKGAKAIFEPALVGSYQYQDDKRKNTVQEMINQGFAPEFWEDSFSQQLAIEELLPTGGKVRLGFSQRDFSSSVNDKYGVDKEKQTVVGVSLIQPLLKDGGFKPTMAAIRMAEADRDIAFQNYRVQTMRVMAEAIAGYWDLYLARQKYRVRRESEHTAEEVLRDNIARMKTGRMSETEVLEAQAALAMRKALVSEAKQAIVSALNSVRTYLSSSVSANNVEIEPSEEPHVEEVKKDFADSLSKALALRGEYLSSRKKIEREDIRLAFAENQLWPQIDLKGSYNLNGLTDKFGHPMDDALEREHPTWSLGLEMRVPLGGSKKAASELEATKQRKRQALLELKAVEVSLTNAVDTALRNMENAKEQVLQQAGAVEINRRLLKTESQRFTAGKSNSRTLLEREETLNNAREGEVEGLVRYMKSLYQLELAEGSLLVNQGVDVMEAGVK